MLLKVEGDLKKSQEYLLSYLWFIFISQLIVMESFDLQNFFYFSVWFSYSKLISQTKLLVLFFISVGGKKLGR